MSLMLRSLGAEGHRLVLKLRGYGPLPDGIVRHALPDATRLFLYRGDMYREWLAYGSDAKRIAESFTAGINAYVDLLDEHPELLPPEFDLLDYRPARWSPSAASWRSCGERGLRCRCW